MTILMTRMRTTRPMKTRGLLSCLCIFGDYGVGVRAGGYERGHDGRVCVGFDCCYYCLVKDCLRLDRSDTNANQNITAKLK